MNVVWQNVIVIALVALAIVYVIRQAWLVLAKRKSGCGSGCNSCSATDENAAKNQAKPFVASDELQSTFKPSSTRRAQR